VQILASSRVYLFIPLSGPAGTDWAALPPPLIALIRDDGSEPSDTDFTTGVWMAPDPASGPEAALLVGPGGTVALPAGTYMAFARLVAGVEQVTVPSGRVRVGAG
jgi:hypothetical protein